MAENLYKVWNTSQLQPIRTDKIVTGTIVAFNMAPDEVIDVFESERGPTMELQLDTGKLKIIETTPGQTPPSVSIGVTPDQKDALNNANSPSAANPLATVADLQGYKEPVTTTLWVDKNRQDTYMPDGSIERPFKSINTALVAAATAESTYGNAVIVVMPGTYAETLTITDKVHIVGLMEDSVFIITDAPNRGVIQVGAVTGTPKGVIFERLTVANTSDTVGACALEVTTGYNNIGGVKFMDGILSNSGTVNGKALIVNADAAATLYLDIAGRNQFVAGDVELNHAAGAGLATYAFSSVNAENSNLDINVGAGRKVLCVGGTRFKAGQPTVVSGDFLREPDLVSSAF